MRVAVWAVLIGLGAEACCSSYATSGCLEIRDISRAATVGALDELREYLGDQRSWVREEAAQALGQPRFQPAVPDLLRVLTDLGEKRYVRAAAARSLGQIRDGTALDALIGVAADATAAPELKLAVIDGLCALDPQSGPGLQAIRSLAQDQDIIVAAVAQSRAEAQCAR